MNAKGHMNATHIQYGVFNAMNMMDRTSQILVGEVLFDNNSNNINWNSCNNNNNNTEYDSVDKQIRG